MSAKTWIKRTCVLAAVGMMAVAAMGTQAEAANTASQNFIVQTQVNQACTFTSADLVFAGYTTGTSNPVTGTSAWTVNCPGASATNTIPVSFSMTATGGFVMKNAAATSSLNYQLCDGPCATGTPYPANGTAGPSVGVNAAPFTYTLNGNIPANQTPLAGAHSQTVAVFMTY